MHVVIAMDIYRNFVLSFTFGAAAVVDAAMVVRTEHRKHTHIKNKDIAVVSLWSFRRTRVRVRVKVRVN